MASDFIAFGKSAICASHVTHAEWVYVGPMTGPPKLVVATTSGGVLSLLADDPDAEKAAKAVGLDKHYAEWDESVKAVAKAAAAAEARVAAVAAAEEALAKAHAEEVAKQEAKIAAEVEKAEKAHAKAEHAHK